MSDASKNRSARLSSSPEDKLVKFGFTSMKVGCSMMVLGIALPILALILFFVVAVVWSWIFPAKNDSAEASPVASSLNQAGGGFSSTGSDDGQPGQFKYIFDGRTVQIGDFRHVELMSLIEAIYEGVISDDDAARCLVYPSKSIVSSACELQQVVGQHLIFEGNADGNASYTLAVLRDSSFESKRPSMVENYSDMRGTGMQEIMPGVALAFSGREEFTTKGGFVRKVPTFRVVNSQP